MHHCYACNQPCDETELISINTVNGIEWLNIVIHHKCLYPNVENTHE